jgi:hypothetical protein
MPTMPSMDVNLNARLMPLDRGGRFEDPLEELLRDKLSRFEVTGGGTMMNKNREPVSCDIEISFKGNADEALRLVAAALERLGAPKGSRASSGKDQVTFGVTEGIGIYLNGTDLPDEVYQANDINELVARIDASLGEAGELYSHWRGPTETALYYYGPSAARMRELVAGVLSTHPLAQLSRVEQLAP